MPSSHNSIFRRTNSTFSIISKESNNPFFKREHTDILHSISISQEENPVTSVFIVYVTAIDRLNRIQPINQISWKIL